jgi:hypothetical protein
MVKPKTFTDFLIQAIGDKKTSMSKAYAYLANALYVREISSP